MSNTTLELYVTFDHGQEPADADYGNTHDTYEDATKSRATGQGIASLVYEFDRIEVVDDSYAVCELCGSANCRRVDPDGCEPDCTGGAEDGEGVARGIVRMWAAYGHASGRVYARHENRATALLMGAKACTEAGEAELLDVTAAVDGRWPAGEVWIGGYPVALGPSLKLCNHSPTGFAWGYLGSGPAQLALALLLHLGASDAEAQAWYQDFQAEVVTKWTYAVSFTRPVSELLGWIEARRAKVAK